MASHSLKHQTTVPATGSLHLLFPVWHDLLPEGICYSFTSFMSALKYYLSQEDSPTTLYKRATLPKSPLNYLIPILHYYLHDHLIHIRLLIFIMSISTHHVFHSRRAKSLSVEFTALFPARDGVWSATGTQ